MKSPLLDEQGAFFCSQIYIQNFSDASISVTGK